MLRMTPKNTACVAIDMHRGHLDPAIGALPLPAEGCVTVIDRAAALFRKLRDRGVPIVHVVTEYRDSNEIMNNPFWSAIQDDPNKARKGMARHNLMGTRGTEVMPDLLDPRDFMVHNKKRYSPYVGTDLLFLLRSRLQVDTLILARINTTSCVLCCGFESTNLDFRVVIAADAVDSMDGEEMHRFALKLMAATIGWPMTNTEILDALAA